MKFYFERLQTHVPHDLQEHHKQNVNVKSHILKGNRKQHSSHSPDALVQVEKPKHLHIVPVLLTQQRQ